jgi:uncharacterized membrane protein YkoI
VPFGSFTNCLKTFDYTPLDPKSLEHKYYCKETEGITLEVDTTDGERTELTKVEKGVVEPKAELTPSASAPVPSSSAPVEEKPAVGGDASGGGNPVVGAKISEATAKATALARVPGIVTDISIEAPFDKPLYVVEIKPSGGGAEVDVSIDMQTGVILSVD